MLNGRPLYLRGAIEGQFLASGYSLPAAEEVRRGAAGAVQRPTWLSRWLLIIETFARLAS